MTKSFSRPSRISPALAEYFARYSTWHRNPVNRFLHHFGMFFMIWGIIAALDRVPLGFVAGQQVTLAMPLLCIVLGWYVSLDWRIAVAAAAWYLPCIPLGREAPLTVIGAATLLGAAAQFTGHCVFEPIPLKLLASVRYAMIAPVFFLALTMRLWSFDRLPER